MDQPLVEKVNDNGGFWFGLTEGQNCRTANAATKLALLVTMAA